MATGRLTKEVFNFVVTHPIRFKTFINYFLGWKVESITFQDQIFIFYMEMRQNYTNLHFIVLWPLFQTLS